MDRKDHKRKSNLLITIGYCLVAAIILFNYVGGGRANRIKKISAKFKTKQESNTNLSYLRKQLIEEKRVNSAMRGALQTYQQAVKGSIISNNQLNKLTLKTLDNSIPKLNRISTVKDGKSPFVKGKNPFLSFSHRSNTVVKTPKIIKSIFSGLKSHPRIPFVTSGSNDKILLTGN